MLYYRQHSRRARLDSESSQQLIFLRFSHRVPTGALSWLMPKSCSFRDSLDGQTETIRRAASYMVGMMGSRFRINISCALNLLPIPLFCCYNILSTCDSSFQGVRSEWAAEAATEWRRSVDDRLLGMVPPDPRGALHLLYVVNDLLQVRTTNSYQRRHTSY